LIHSATGKKADSCVLFIMWWYIGKQNENHMIMVKLGGNASTGKTT